MNGDINHKDPNSGQPENLKIPSNQDSVESQRNPTSEVSSKVQTHPIEKREASVQVSADEFEISPKIPDTKTEIQPKKITENVTIKFKKKKK
jgi:hypothetical protein